MGEAGVTGASTTSGVVRFAGTTMGRGARVMDPATTAAQFHHGREAMCTASTAATWLSGAAGFAASGEGLGVQALPPLLPHFHLLYVFQSPPPSDTQVCGSLQHPGVLGRGTSVELGLFY